MIDALFIKFSLLCTSMQFYCPLPSFIRTPVPLTAFNRVLSIFSLYSDIMYLLCNCTPTRYAGSGTLVRGGRCLNTLTRKTDINQMMLKLNKNGLYMYYCIAPVDDTLSKDLDNDVGLSPNKDLQTRSRNSNNSHVEKFQ